MLVPVQVVWWSGVQKGGVTIAHCNTHTNQGLEALSSTISGEGDDSDISLGQSAFLHHLCACCWPLAKSLHDPFAY